MNIKQFNGIKAASPEKRYKHFISMAADGEDVWLLSSDSGYATEDFDGRIHLVVFAEKEFAEWFRDQFPEYADDSIEKMDVHDFVAQCEKLLGQDEIRFAVFPTEKDLCVATVAQVYNDLTEELSLLE